MELSTEDVVTLVTCLEFLKSDYINTLSFSEQMRNLGDANSAIEKLKSPYSQIHKNESRVIQASLLHMQLFLSESGVPALPGDPLNIYDLERLYPIFEVV